MRYPASTGKVANSATGAGIGNVLLTITGAHFPAAWWRGAESIFTEKDGTFRVRVAPGETTVQIISFIPGYQEGEYSQSVTMVAGKTTKLPTIAVPR